MEKNPDKFDFQATVHAVQDAVLSVVCHILFDFALVGLGVAFVLALCAVVLKAKNHRFVPRFFAVSKRVSLACLGLAVPGILCLLFTGKLPDSGVYINFSGGFLVLWTMVTIYLCAEEMNYAWFGRSEDGEDEPQSDFSGSPSSTIADPEDAAGAEQADEKEHLTDKVAESLANFN